MTLRICLGWLVLGISSCLAQPVLIKDINTTPLGFAPSQLSPSFLTIGDHTFFATRNYGELWHTDGTEAGTYQLNGDVGGVMANLNGTLIYSTNQNSALGRSDGTLQGTDVYHTLDYANISNLFELDGKVIFIGRQFGQNTQIGSTDGTSEGTTILKTIPTDISSSSYSWSPVRMGDYVYMFIPNGGATTELWRTDGTEEGTTKIVDLGSFPKMIAMNSTLYFNKGSELWKTDGTSEGTALIKDLEEDEYSNSFSYMGLFNGKMIISGSYYVFISDGTAAGTTNLGNFQIANGGAIWHSKFYGIGSNGLTSRYLFSTDGTPAGTKQLFSLGEAGYGDRKISIVNDTFIVPVQTSQTGLELFVYDGVNTPQILKDINPGSPNGINAGVTSDLEYKVVGDQLIFFADDGEHGVELWKTNGTPGGTQIIKDAHLGNDGSTWEYSPVISVNGTKLLPTKKSWTSYYRVKDNPLDADLLLSETKGTIGVSNNKLFFLDQNYKISVTDGTNTGTVLKDYGYPNVYPPVTEGVVASLGNKTIFRYSFPDSYGIGTELFVTDGTPENSSLLKDINPGEGNGLSWDNDTGRFGKISESLIVFAGDDGTTGLELWKTDGTADGTMLLKEIYSGPTSANIRNMNVIDGVAYFSTTNGAVSQLWRTDGTAGGTFKLKDFQSYAGPQFFTKIDGNIYFLASDDNVNSALWITDGTVAGTKLIVVVTTWFSSPLIESGGRLFFEATDDEHGHELWISDGTKAGTHVIDIVEGPGSSDPKYLVAVEGGIYFNALGQLWSSNGSIEETKKVEDINPGVISNYEGTLYFNAFEAEFGREYYKYTPEPLLPLPKQDQNIVFSLHDHNYSESTFELNATASSGLPISFSTTSDKISISGTTVTILSAGKATIVATQEGNGVFEAAEDIEITICLNPPKPIWTGSTPNAMGQDWQFYRDGTAFTPPITETGNYSLTTTIEGCVSPISDVAHLEFGKQDQTVTFNPTNHSFDEETFELEASTTSELPILFTPNNDNITINGTTATISKAGKVTITATQQGNEDFYSAEESKIICINPPEPIISFVLEISNGFNGSISETEGAQWFFNGEPIPGSTGQSPSPANATGDYSVQVTIDGCASPMSDVVHFMYSGLEDEMPGVHVYPNPANDFLYVNSPKETGVEIINSLGQLIQATNFSGSVSIPVSGFSKGVYFLKISSNNKVAFKKFLKE